MFGFLTKYEQFTAIALATIFHAGIGLYIFINGTQNTSFLSQSLQVSLVTPSTSVQVKSKFEAHAKQNNKNLEKIGIKSAKENTKKKGKGFREQKTSGKESPNAKALNSVITEPIFNAIYLNNPAPIYPASAKRDNIQGKVLLLVEVSSDGLAKNIEISKSSGYSLLDNAAKNAVLSWKFIPAKQYGKTINANVLVPIEFKLS